MLSALRRTLLVPAPPVLFVRPQIRSVHACRTTLLDSGIESLGDRKAMEVFHHSRFLLEQETVPGLFSVVLNYRMPVVTLRILQKCKPFNKKCHSWGVRPVSSAPAPKSDALLSDLARRLFSSHACTRYFSATLHPYPASGSCSTIPHLCGWRRQPPI